MKRLIQKQKTRSRRKRSIRKKISGTADVPRVSVFRSNKHVYVQAINDVAGVTIASASDGQGGNEKKSPVEKAFVVGRTLGENVKKKKIDRIVFDRSGYKYHGRVKALADGLREAGLSF